MKKSFRVFALFLGFSILLTACDLFDDPEPPSTEELLMDQMPYTQYIISYWRGWDMARFQLQWSQQLSGIRSTHLEVDRYEMRHFHNDDIWYFYYNNIFRELQNMISMSNELNSRAYRGISRILQAYSLGFVTDTWGDVPHEFAIRYYTQEPLPEYDEQQQLYLEIMQLLELGLQDLEAATNNPVMVPGPEADPIYKGNLEQWKRAANVIRLRHLLRMGNHSGNYSNALGHLTSRQGFASNQDDMVYIYNEGLEQYNPHYFFDNERQHTRVGAFLVNMLKETNDPRTEVFLTRNTAGEYIGSSPAEGLVDASFPGPALASRTAPTTLIGFTEQKFMEAELYWRTGSQAQADQAFQEAVISSLRSFDIEDPDWEAEHAEIENVSLEQIMNAKYVALFLNPEVWTDYRRTGYPELPPYEYAQVEEIPRRFLYPAEEFNINSQNVPADVDIYTRMWWDVN